MLLTAGSQLLWQPQSISSPTSSSGPFTVRLTNTGQLQLLDAACGLMYSSPQPGTTGALGKLVLGQPSPAHTNTLTAPPKPARGPPPAKASRSVRPPPASAPPASPRAAPRPKPAPKLSQARSPAGVTSAAPFNRPRPPPVVHTPRPPPPPPSPRGPPLPSRPRSPTPPQQATFVHVPKGSGRGAAGNSTSGSSLRPANRGAAASSGGCQRSQPPLMPGAACGGISACGADAMCAELPCCPAGSSCVRRTAFTWLCS